nr:hypothetical protein [Microcoleus sp. PH2017_24_DOB_U_A]
MTALDLKGNKIRDISFARSPI